MRTLKSLLAGATVLSSTVWSAPANAAGPLFMGLGDLPGGSLNSSATGVSIDGSVVVGTSGKEAFRWTPISGMIGLGAPPGVVNSSRANGVSADGSVVVGRTFRSGGHARPPISEAFRWTQAAGMVGLGDLPGGNSQSEAYAVSADGIVVVGRDTRSQDRIEAFRWTQTGGMVGLGDLGGGSFQSYAYAVSADGSVIVGSGVSTSGRTAFRWRQTSGMVGLGDLPGGTSDSVANGVSADGSIIVGQGNSDAGAEAFRWTESAGMVGLGDLPDGDFISTAFADSADGSMVVGQGRSALGNEAFLWDATHGMRSLRDVLVNDFGLGASLTGWTLLSANDISDDGQFIVGTGTNPSGDAEAWLARLDPAPMLPGDFDGDGDVDGRDFLAWQRGGSPNPLSASDLADWQANYGMGSLAEVRPTPTTAAQWCPVGARDPARWSVVPEPGSVVIMGLAWMVCAARLSARLRCAPLCHGGSPTRSDSRLTGNQPLRG